MLVSVGSVGDAYDNAMAESFVDSFKTELIADRVWVSRSRLELALVEYVGWFNHDRLHESLGDIPPVEFEQLHVTKSSISPNGSVEEPSPRAAERLRMPRPESSEAGEHPHRTESGPPADDRAADGSLRSRYALAALTVGAERDYDPMSSCRTHQTQSPWNPVRLMDRSRVAAGGPQNVFVGLVFGGALVERRGFSRFWVGGVGPVRAGVLPWGREGVRLVVGASRGRVEVQTSGARGLPRDFAL